MFDQNAVRTYPIKINTICVHYLSQLTKNFEVSRLIKERRLMVFVSSSYQLYLMSASQISHSGFLTRHTLVWTKCQPRAIDKEIGALGQERGSTRVRRIWQNKCCMLQQL